MINGLNSGMIHSPIMKNTLFGALVLACLTAAARQSGGS
jgi:hypothetical protein